MRRFRMIGGIAAASIAGVGLAFTALATGCSDNEVSTDLKPEGPPEILQMFVVERVTQGAATRTLSQLAFGSHPDIDESDDGVVTTAVARSGQRIRVVFDELLLGNALEEIACADGTFSRVPVGTNPDDVAKCSGGAEALVNCTAVCIGPDGPIGILDETGAGAGRAEPDGAPDDLRMIAGAASITCDGTDIPINLEQSFYQPSGNQLITAGPLGVNSLGPAIILVPTDGLRAGAQCNVTFADDVVDKDGNRPCTATGGACTPGDVSGLTWTVEGLKVSGTSPADEETGVALTSGGSSDADVLIQFNSAIDTATLGGITVEDETNGGFGDCAAPAVAPCLMRTVNMADPTIVTVTVVGGFTADNEHTVTISTAVTDIFGGGVSAPVVIKFTTGGVTPVADAAPDAEPADAGIDAN